MRGEIPILKKKKKGKNVSLKKKKELFRARKDNWWRKNQIPIENKYQKFPIESIKKRKNELFNRVANDSKLEKTI